MGYPSDLTDKQWELIREHFEGENRGQHLRKHEKRQLINGVLYVVKTGCQWRQLPHDFPPYTTVWNFYRRARIKGLWEKILAELVAKSRVAAGRSKNPTRAWPKLPGLGHAAAVHRSVSRAGRRTRH